MQIKSNILGKNKEKRLKISNERVSCSKSDKAIQFFLSFFHLPKAFFIRSDRPDWKALNENNRAPYKYLRFSPSEYKTSS